MYPENLEKYVPPEFDLAKYDKCRDMDIFDWIVNISTRLTPYIFTMGAKYELDPKQIALIEGYVDSNISSGVICPEPSEKAGFENFINALVIQKSAIVKEMSLFELFSLTDIHKTEAREKLYSEIDPRLYQLILRDGQGELDKPIQSDLYDNFEASWLRIDMECSKKEIQEAFNSWLEKAKKKQEINNKSVGAHQRVIKNFNETTFKKWYTAKVLSYIDLVTWNTLRGNKLSDKIITDIIFCNEKHFDFEPINFLRLTTRPHVKKLMFPNTVRRMVNVLSQERCKKKG